MTPPSWRGLVHIMCGLFGAAPSSCTPPPPKPPPPWIWPLPVPRKFDAIRSQLEFCPSIGRVQ